MSELEKLKPIDVLPKTRLIDGRIAQLMGWREIKITRTPASFKCLPDTYSITGIPALPRTGANPFARCEIPHYTSDKGEAERFALTFGLQLRPLKSGFLARHVSKLHAEPWLDAHVEVKRGRIRPAPEVLCIAVLEQVQGALKELEGLRYPPPEE